MVALRNGRCIGRDRGMRHKKTPLQTKERRRYPEKYQSVNGRTGMISYNPCYVEWLSCFANLQFGVSLSNL